MKRKKPNIDGYKVRFSYRVDGKEYKRFQKYGKEKIFQIGEEYEVDYSMENPGIAILKIL